MDESAARARFAAARVARLATVGADGLPDLVPVVFAVSVGTDRPDIIYTAVDTKPKRTTALRRLDNVAVHPGVTLLVDHYDDRDWDALWWVRAEGSGRVLSVDTAEARTAIGLLQERYRQHRADPPPGPVLAITVSRWSGWEARPAGR